MSEFALHWSHYCLFAVCGLAFWQSPASGFKAAWDNALTRAAILFLGNATVLTAYWAFVDPILEWRLQLAVDLICAIIITRHPGTVFQGWMGILFGTRIGASLAYGIWGTADASYDYWLNLNFAGRALMFLLLVWGEAEGGRFAILWNRASRWLVHHRPFNAFVGGKK